VGNISPVQTAAVVEGTEGRGDEESDRAGISRRPVTDLEEPAGIADGWEREAGNRPGIPGGRRGATRQGRVRPRKSSGSLRRRSKIT
jgi:hypothetical protein